MKKMSHTTQLATRREIRFKAYYRHHSKVEVGKIADIEFGFELPGTWLTCYLLRRFGWPNIGSDAYKDLATWVLTTPMPGVVLTITPYLGHNESRRNRPLSEKLKRSIYTRNLSFGFGCSKEIQKALDRNPALETQFKRSAILVRRWWHKEGQYLYTIGSCKREDTSEELLAGADNPKSPDLIEGIFKRKPGHPKQPRLPAAFSDPMGIWWLSDKFFPHHAPGLLNKLQTLRLQRRNAHKPPTRLQLSVESALRRTLRDLKRPVFVRDLGLNVLGSTEHDPAAEDAACGLPTAERFSGAGYAPQYWFGHPRLARSE